MKRWLAALLVAALAAPVAAAQEPSLAEAARREKERRKAQKKEGAPAATFTDEDLKVDREGAGTVSSPAATGTRSRRPASSAEPGGGDAEKKVWFNRAEAIRKSIAAEEQRIPQLEQQITDLRNDMAPNPADALDPNRLQKREAEIGRLMGEVEAARAELASQKQALSELEEEARAKGIPPGWLEGRFSG